MQLIEIWPVLHTAATRYSSSTCSAEPRSARVLLTQSLQTVKAQVYQY